LIEPFEYTDDKETWIPYPRSPINLTSFNQKLKERFGENLFGKARIKCVWGGGEREIKPDGRWGLKYFRVFAKPSLNFNEHTLLFVATQEREELGIPRFIIERYKQPSELPPSDWQRFPRGRYVQYYEVEGLGGKYRVPGDDTIEHIASCLAGEEEYQKQLDLELEKLKREEEEDCERNVSGENIPFNTPQLISA
jgi:hypothetical protein